MNPFVRSRSILRILVLCFISGLLNAATFVVTHSEDTGGPGSLRQSLADANAQAGPDTITFNIPQADAGYDAADGVWILTGFSGALSLTGDSTTVDGFSQTVNQGDTNPNGPEIVLDGTGMPNPAYILWIQSRGNTIVGLIIQNSPSVGIQIFSENAKKNRIIGNFIGVGASGTDAQGNSQGIQITTGADSNQIGGPEAMMRNIISANGAGINIIDSRANVIQNNYIGTDRTGTLAIGNDRVGVIAGRKARGNLIGGANANEGNLISGNGWYGISIQYDQADSNQVSWNRIGTTSAGDAGLANLWGGIQVLGNTTRNSIGPSNTIRYNNGPGVVISGSGALFNRITRNSISDNTELGISLENGGNASLEAPVITRLNSVSGTSLPNATVEIYSSHDSQGAVFESTVTADATGLFHWAGTPAGPWVTALQQDENGNTSPFSEAKHLGPFVVTTTADTGEGSLRQAIDLSNETTGPDSILFNLSREDAGFDGTVWRIRPATPLPVLLGGGTVINGNSQDVLGNSNPLGPDIVLSGSDMGDWSVGFQINSADNVISGLVIQSFAVYGIYILEESAHHNHVWGNYIGTAENGTDSSGCDLGILLSDDSYDNRIGGSEAFERNVIACNRLDDIRISQSRNNRILGNWIGLGRDGIAALKNGENGITIRNSASGNQIGGMGEFEGNIIAAHQYFGILITDEGCNENHILWNTIGTLPHMDVRIGNGLDGIQIKSGASLNIIGPGNRIAYNGEYGIQLFGPATIRNHITLNSITDNVLGGIRLTDGANKNLEAPVITRFASVIGTAPPGTMIEIFSDSSNQGRFYEGAVSADATGNFTYIGPVSGPSVTATATDAEGNTSPFSAPKRVGSWIVSHTRDAGEGSLRWAINGSNAATGPDVIEFNIPESDAGFDGSVWWIALEKELPDITDSETTLDGTSQEARQGDHNPAGPDIFIDGRDIPGGPTGIQIFSASNHMTGMGLVGFGNAGLTLRDSLAKDNRITRCFVGIGPHGEESIPNGRGIQLVDGAHHNQIGSEDFSLGNCISGNERSGLYILDADSNQVIGNRIGSDNAGGLGIGNENGILISGFASGNQIGGSEPGERNVISGNRLNGIQLSGEGVSGNRIQGNFIGIDSSGSRPLGNEGIGIWVHSRAHHNLIGGLAEGEGNVISGNQNMGINLGTTDTDNNQIAGNRVGTDIHGLQPIPNRYEGIRVHSGARHNRIGPGNLVSGNKSHGIELKYADTDSNTIFGNWIGLNAAGTDTIPNRKNGIQIGSGPRFNRIGGPENSERNITSGNRWSGLVISPKGSEHNLVQNNYVGTDTSGQHALGNHDFGIDIMCRSTTIEGNLVSGNRLTGILLEDTTLGVVIRYNKVGVAADGLHPLPNGDEGIRIQGVARLDTIGPGNQIWYNATYGIELHDSTVQQITITENSISRNARDGILLLYTANENAESPTIIRENPVTGMAMPGSRVEIFSDSLGQGRLFEAAVLADASGAWIWDGNPSGPNVTTTATLPSGSTSGFSGVWIVSVDHQPSLIPPASYYLAQNYPNPFNPTTTISFGVEKKCHVRLIIFNLIGQEMAELIDMEYQPGHYKITFDASTLASGIYFCRISMGKFEAVRKLVLLE